MNSFMGLIGCKQHEFRLAVFYLIYILAFTSIYDAKVKKYLFGPKEPSTMIPYHVDLNTIFPWDHYRHCLGG